MPPSAGPFKWPADAPAPHCLRPEGFPKISERSLPPSWQNCGGAASSANSVAAAIGPATNCGTTFITSRVWNQSLLRTRTILEMLKEFRPQLLHAHFATEATAMAIELAGEAGIPFTFYRAWL